MYIVGRERNKAVRKQVASRFLQTKKAVRKQVASRFLQTKKAVRKQKFAHCHLLRK